MQSLLKYFYYTTLRHDLINKFRTKKRCNILKLKKIVLNFGFKKTDVKLLVSGLLSLELITKQKSMLTFTKKAKVLLKIRKGSPVGCKVILQNQKLFFFLENLIFKILPKLKFFNGFKICKKLNKNVFSYEIHEVFSFSELEKHYYYFLNLPKLDVTLITNAKSKKELVFFLSLFQLPFKNLR